MVWNSGGDLIYKKGDRLDCNHYSSITVLNTAYKIFSLILQDRFVPHVQEILSEIKDEN